MCGLIAVFSNDNNAPIKALKSLELLEYRGYDSAGLASINDNKIITCKAVGKMKKLKQEFTKNSFNGEIAIAHTRWATHGKPTLNNTHPHIYGNVAVVHNGIIENHLSLRKNLESKGYEFKSETDTEVIAVLIQSFIDEGKSSNEAVYQAITLLEGSYALAIIISSDETPTIYASSLNVPLILGKNEDDKFLSSDLMAISNDINGYYRMEDNQLMIISAESEKIISLIDQSTTIPFFTEISSTTQVIDKQGFEHFMLKEIHEQPEIITKIIDNYYDKEADEINLSSCDIDFSYYEKIEIIACGTSYNAGVSACYMMEEIANVACEVHLASEFRYRDIVFNSKSIYIFISQSGETADVLQSHHFCQENGCITFALVNNITSTLAVNADCYLDIMAGVEIGVASTKAFIAQQLSLLLLAYKLANIHDVTPKYSLSTVIENLKKSVTFAKEELLHDKKIKKLCQNFKNHNSTFYLGRGISYGLALEGSLKFKELTYIHSEGIAAGELKHGPLALVDKNMLVIMIAPHDKHFEKIISNLQEINARDGKVILISSQKEAENYKDLIFDYIDIPYYDPYSCAILNTLPLQLIAYYTATILGNDVDQPRNLAKSVTVE